jgi:outer membrane receptor protein involved in Fe transport
LFGTIAAGGAGRQRLNLDRMRVQGLEASARWMTSKQLTLKADYIRNEAEVRRASLAPALVGNRIAQVPRDSASFGAVWQAPWQLTFTPRVRYIGRQFEDDENQLILGAVVIADLSISRPLSERIELFVTAENIGDARIETGRTADGLVNTGTPRFIVGGLRGTW